jgi:hypothetical protein
MRKDRSPEQSGYHNTQAQDKLKEWTAETCFSLDQHASKISID